MLIYQADPKQVPRPFPEGSAEKKEAPGREKWCKKKERKDICGLATFPVSRGTL